ncbi:hypothetical protein BpHYR1_044576 [Brachionus plicatilis]|uniref:Uncharacterized protein n=1 Tax=Brachionus plicatilis TaxID=10195 RepID=A0A3M7PRE1_BRAPC|nr:hypothetical protein BpHYR1_044576 [Brachionus plicatilis]
MCIMLKLYLIANLRIIHRILRRVSFSFQGTLSEEIRLEFESQSIDLFRLGFSSESNEKYLRTHESESDFISFGLESKKLNN